MSTGLIPGDESHVAKGGLLRSLDDYVRFGEFAAASSFAPKDMRGKPADCTLAIMLGAELGLGPMGALQGIAVINGRATAWGDSLIAIVKASPLCEYVHEEIQGEGEAMTARCEAKRRGDPEPTVATFSVADAKRARLWGKDGPWTQYPARMLQMRARGFALRDCFPDVLRGLISREEAEDFVVEHESRRQSPRKVAPAAKVVEPVAAEATAASTAEPFAQPRRKTMLEQALEKVDAASSADALAEIQVRADELLASSKMSVDDHAKITASVDMRADFLRTVKTIGGPPNGEGQA